VGASGVVFDGGDALQLACLVGACDCDCDLPHFGARLHPCFNLLHWKQAQSSFLAHGSWRCVTVLLFILSNL